MRAEVNFVILMLLATIVLNWAVYHDESIEEGSQFEEENEVEGNVPTDELATRRSKRNKVIKKYQELALHVVGRYNFTQDMDIEGKIIPGMSHLMRFSNESAIVQRMLLRITHQSQFVFAWAGTSVTAAHDNYYEEGWAARFYAISKDVFDAAGVRLESRNIAMGGNPVYPYILCLETHSGPDVDVLGWEMEMMCHDRMRQDSYEGWIRRSFAMDSRPSILLMGSFVDTGPEEFASNAFMKFYASTTAAPHEILFYKMWKLLYPQFPENHVQVKRWALANKCCGGASWHPGPRGHQFFADMLALNYLRLFVDAVSLWADGLSPADTRGSTGFPRSYVDYQMTLKNGVAFDTADASVVPKLTCLTMYEPKYDKSKELLNYIQSIDSSVQNYKERVITSAAEWEKSGKKDGRWLYTLCPNNIGPVRGAESKHANYTDYKWTVYGDASCKPITFKFEASVGPLVVCSPPQNWGQWDKGFWAMNINTTRATLDGRPINFHQYMIGNDGHCFRSVQDIQHTGAHTLEISALSPDTIIQISHLVFLSA